MITVTSHEGGMEVVSEGKIGVMLRELLLINIDVLKHIYTESPMHKAVSFERFADEMMSGMTKDIVAYIKKMGG